MKPVVIEGGIEYEFEGYAIGSILEICKMKTYRVRILIDRVDKSGTESADIHIGNVNTSEITPLVEFAKKLTQEFGKLDELTHGQTYSK